MTRDEAHKQVEDLVNKFYSDLMYTAPELHDMRLGQLKLGLYDVVDDILEHRDA
jgi:hypothetical protein